MTVKDCFDKMWSQNPSLFPNKMQYLIDHTDSGRSIFFNMLPKSMRSRLRIDNMHLIGNMKFTDVNGFPVLAQNNPDNLDFDLFSYSDRNKHHDRPWGIHFFQYDNKFIRAITDGLETTTRAIYGCEAVFGPDCSLYVDAPEFINKMNIWRNRFATAYWQYCGYKTIQTASWADANSLKYSFEGLAEHSVTAVCGIGHDFCKSAKHLWRYAVEKLIEMKSPTQLIIYGGKRDILLDIGVPIVYIEDFITKRFRKDEKTKIE